MDRQFGLTDVFAFDLHSVVQPLGDPTMLQDSFRFLADPDSYRLQYEAQRVVNTENLAVAPLAQDQFSDNHFWKFFCSIRHDLAQGTPDYWKLQVPFSCKLLTNNIRLIIEDEKIEVGVTLNISISAIGWWTTLHMRLKQEMTALQLLNLIGKLRGKPTSGDVRVFDFAGHRLPIWDVFRKIQGYLFDEVYSKSNPPAEVRVLDRYIVISPSKVTGPLQHFKTRGQSADEMSDEESASFLSILYGIPVDLRRFAEEYSNKKFSVVRFHDLDPAFALSEFDKGTFLMMQKTAAIGSRRTSRRLGCFASNVKCIVAVVRALHYFCNSEFAKNFGKTDPVIGPLLASAKTSLNQLGHNYQHDFCKYFFAKFNPLKTLQS